MNFSILCFLKAHLKKVRKTALDKKAVLTSSCSMKLS